MTEGQEKSTHNGIRFIKGEIVQRIEYTPFGKERYVLNAALKQGPKFTDQVNDIEDDLYFYQSRYYDPVLGRFIQPDTVPAAGPNPQTINAYSYALNNPLKYIDPTGHSVDAPSEDEGGDEDAGGLSQDPSVNPGGLPDVAKDALAGNGTTSPPSNNAANETTTSETTSTTEGSENNESSVTPHDITSFAEQASNIVEQMVNPERGKLRAAAKGAGKVLEAVNIVTQEGGPGQVAGGIIGTGVGGAVGSYFGGKLGGILGAAAGGVAGSFVGSLFDSPTAGELNPHEKEKR